MYLFSANRPHTGKPNPPRTKNTSRNRIVTGVRKPYYHPVGLALNTIKHSTLPVNFSVGKGEPKPTRPVATENRGRGS